MSRKQKSNLENFTGNSLPKTRKAQFFDIFSHKFGILTSIGTTLLISVIPLIVTVLYESTFLLGIISAEEYVTDGVLNSTGYNLFVSNKYIFSAIKIACYTIIFIVLGGLLRVLRQLYWGKHVNFIHEFFKGFKDNIKNSLIFGLIFGLSRFVFEIIGISDLSSIVLILIYGVNFVLIYPLIIIGMVYTSLYNATFMKTCYHSMLLYIKKFPYILAPLLILVAMPLLSFISVDKFVLKIILIIVLMFVFVPIYLLFLYAIEIYCFDATINHIYFPELENKGLVFEDEESD